MRGVINANKTFKKTDKTRLYLIILLNLFLLMFVGVSNISCIKRSETKETKETKETEETENSKETKGTKEAQEIKEAKETKGTKEAQEIEEDKETRGTKEAQEIEEDKETRGTKEAQEIKEAKETEKVEKVNRGDTGHTKKEFEPVEQLPSVEAALPASPPSPSPPVPFAGSDFDPSNSTPEHFLEQMILEYLKFIQKLDAQLNQEWKDSGWELFKIIKEGKQSKEKRVEVQSRGITFLIPQTLQVKVRHYGVNVHNLLKTKLSELNDKYQKLNDSFLNKSKLDKERKEHFLAKLEEFRSQQDIIMRGFENSFVEEYFAFFPYHPVFDFTAVAISIYLDEVLQSNQQEVLDKIAELHIRLTRRHTKFQIVLDKMKGLLNKKFIN